MYFKAFITPLCGKRSAVTVARQFQRTAQLKRERGEFFIHPAVAPVSLLRDYSVCDLTHGPAHLGGQNLAALCTTAGQNLAAVGSSHSLTETVDLGTVTLGGLIGTLHYFTPPVNYNYARQPHGRSNT